MDVRPWIGAIFTVLSIQQESAISTHKVYHFDRRIRSERRPPPGPVIDLNESVQLADRTVKCDGVGVGFDPNARGPGLADPEERAIVLNQEILQRQPEPVQLFIFYHECGHHHVGPSETAADCYAVKRALKERWLDELAVQEVCDSFVKFGKRNNKPSGDGHPGALDRCKILKSCYQTALTKLKKDIESAARAARSDPQVAKGRD